MFVTSCCFSCFVLLLYGPYCHGVVKLDPICFDCNIFMALLGRIIL